MRIRTLFIVLAVLVPGSEAVAQSLFSAAGMGVPIEALDGRARALGNLGIGLRGSAFLPTDPAAAARYIVSTGVMAGQPSWVDYASESGAKGRFRGNRFPLLGIAYPMFSGIASVQVGSFLDQHFRSDSQGLVQLSAGPLERTDTFEQDGSVSNLNFGYARMLNGDLSVGVTLGRYAGSVVRTLTRTFGIDGSSDLDEYVEAGTWAYRGYSVTAGVAADVGTAVRIAASLQVPTRLHADASEATAGGDGDFDLPVQYRLGVSAMLAPGLVVSASTALADWSAAGDDLVGTAGAGNTNGVGLGVELSRARFLGKDAPIRFGFRRTGLPFSFDDESASERIWSGGFGLALNTTANVVLAGADFAIERGQRKGAGITERFWRGTVSLVLSGF